MRGIVLVLVASACGGDPAPLAIHGGGTRVQREPALAGVLFRTPVANGTSISSTFGPRWKTSASRYDFHPGIDYFDALGTPVVAIGPGTVEGVYPEGSTQYPLGGNVVVIRHSIPVQPFHGIEVDHVFAVYLHLATIGVTAGAAVTEGQPVGTMGMTGDTEFVHLHFETRVQTTCSLPYQTAHSDASCAIGFDPHVHPFLFAGGADDNTGTLTPLDEPNAYRFVATRGDLDLDVIETDRGSIGFSTRDGLDATSLDTLDNFDRGWIRIVPEEFTSASTEIAYQLYFTDPIEYLEVRDIHGAGLRFE